jgi:hypothetical protein
MKSVMAHIVRHKAMFKKLPLFAMMRDDSLLPRERLSFMRQTAFFIMSFGDINRHLLYRHEAADPHQQRLNAHAEEDANHWQWYLEDLEKLGWNAETTVIDALHALWSDETACTRLLAYELCALVDQAETVERIAIVEAVEETGNVVFESTAALAAPLERELGQPLRFFGPSHLAFEDGHLQNGEHAEIAAIALDDSQRARSVQFVDRVFAAFTAWADEAFALASAELGGRRAAATAPNALPLTP